MLVGGERHNCPATPMKHRPSAPGIARALMLNGQWRDYEAQRGGGWLHIKQSIAPGMSGSPILNRKGAAIAVVSTEQMNPVIVDRLPAGLLRTLVKVKR
jgi:Peptidase S7, Flavivirus NS3 serine protease